MASVFLHVQENEDSAYKNAPRIGQTSLGLPPKMEGLNQN
jgi:hypothetical protein